MSGFKLTYSTMFAPPLALHTHFDQAVEALAPALAQPHGLYIDGKTVMKEDKITTFDPANQQRILGHFSLAQAADVDAAVAAAKKASRTWRNTPWQVRVELLRKVARNVENRLYEIAAAVSYEVGKNRMEALGEVAEVAEFFDLYAADMESHQGYDRKLPDDPLPDFKSHNRSVMKPYGVWAVVAPFNFPFALAGGPTAAALATGNTVVLKGSVETPWSGVLLAECIRDAGIPAGVFNYLVGHGSQIGDALTGHKDVDGVTFTGSYKVGMHIARMQLARAVPRPCIAEMGGKNAAMVTAKANLDVAAQGIIRSAFGMSGQKCSALSRVYVEDSVADALIDKIKAAMANIKIGSPQQQETWIGPVTTRGGYANYARYSDQLNQHGSKVLAGGEQLKHGEFANGLFCAPTLAEAPLDHPLWKEEMFLPVVMLGRVANRDEAMAQMNDSDFGLTAGFFGGDDEVSWFFDNVEAGVTYANRPQGATTGAWPGYQPFGGWKGSGNTGKAIASFYYLPQYMREQSQTHIAP
ncbi:aldehyde dehydrogenase family protein [Leeia oryzae]|uniref:aldehyde dehydrogenase family protein n=1 Tax=Leeia oryzae TaxID=356662 RepID=UPI00037B7777|nr:aldehyde dehydrogenase family protein [Leeia oryzae]